MQGRLHTRAPTTGISKSVPQPDRFLQANVRRCGTRYKTECELLPVVRPGTQRGERRSLVAALPCLPPGSAAHSPPHVPGSAVLAGVPPSKRDARAPQAVAITFRFSQEPGPPCMLEGPQRGAREPAGRGTAPARLSKRIIVVPSTPLSPGEDRRRPAVPSARARITPVAGARAHGGARGIPPSSTASCHAVFWLGATSCYPATLSIRSAVRPRRRRPG